jgi:hypothetical protein
MEDKKQFTLGPFGYNWPTIVEIFGLKKPFPMMSKVRPTHINEIAAPPEAEALKNIAN